MNTLALLGMNPTFAVVILILIVGLLIVAIFGRQWLNQNPAFSTMAAVIVLIAALVYAVFQFTGGGESGPGAITATYYFDVVSGTLFSADVKLVPPIASPDGNTVQVRGKTEPAGVRAVVSSCGGCPGNMVGMTAKQVEEAGARIKYLLKQTPQAKRMLEQMQEHAQEHGQSAARPDAMSGMLIARPPAEAGEAPKYHKGSTVEAEQIMDLREKCPNGKAPRSCSPR